MQVRLVDEPAAARVRAGELHVHGAAEPVAQKRVRVHAGGDAATGQRHRQAFTGGARRHQQQPRLTLGRQDRAGGDVADGPGPVAEDTVRADQQGGDALTACGLQRMAPQLADPPSNPHGARLEGETGVRRAFERVRPGL